MKKVAVLIGAAVVAIVGRAAEAARPDNGKLLKRAEASQGQITKIQPALGMLETSEAVKKGEVAGYVSVALY